MKEYMLVVQDGGMQELTSSIGRSYHDNMSEPVLDNAPPKPKSVTPQGNTVPSSRDQEIRGEDPTIVQPLGKREVKATPTPDSAKRDETAYREARMKHLQGVVESVPAEFRGYLSPEEQLEAVRYWRKEEEEGRVTKEEADFATKNGIPPQFNEVLDSLVKAALNPGTLHNHAGYDLEEALKEASQALEDVERLDEITLAKQGDSTKKSDALTRINAMFSEEKMNSLGDEQERIAFFENERDRFEQTLASTARYVIDKRTQHSASEEKEGLRSMMIKPYDEIIETLSSRLTSENIQATKQEAQQLLDRLFTDLYEFRDRDTARRAEEYQGELEAAGRLDPRRRQRGKDLDDPHEQLKGTGYIDVNSVEDVAVAIMAMDPENYGSSFYNKEYSIAGKDGALGKEGQFALLREEQVRDSTGNLMWKKDDAGNEILDNEKKVPKVGWVIQEDNFMRWVLGQMVYYHDQDPDSSINFMSAVSVENSRLLREINLNMMINRPGIYFKTKQGQVLHDLQEYATQTGWLVGQNRNMDVGYRNEMSSDEEIGTVFMKLYKPDTFGKEYRGRNTFEQLLTMPANYKLKKEEEEEGKDIKIGSATRSTYLINYHITDWEELNRLYNQEGNFGLYRRDVMWEAVKNATASSKAKKPNKVSDTEVLAFAQQAGIMLGGMYEREQNEDGSWGGETGDFKRGIVIGGNFVEARQNPQGEWMYVDPTETDDSKQQKKLDESWYDESGKITGSNTKREDDKAAVQAMLKVINPFDPPTKNRKQLGISRELIKQTVGLRTGLKHKVFGTAGSDMDSLNFGELNGHLMMYWTGGAANQDVSVSAVNAFSKVRHYLLYINKLANPERAGATGNVFEVGFQPSLASDMMTGILMEDKKSTFLSVMKEQELTEAGLRAQGASDNDIATSILKIGEKMRVDVKGVAQYAQQHVANEVKRFHRKTSGTEVRLDQFVKWESDGVMRRMTYETDKMIKAVQEEIIKPTRYALSTHKMNYAHDERMLVGNADGIPEWKQKTKAEVHFNKQSLNVIHKMLKNDKDFVSSMREKAREKGGEFKINELFDQKGNIRRNADGSLTLTAQLVLESPEFGRAGAKAVILEEFAAMIFSHTTTKSDREYFNFGIREGIIRGLGTIPAGFEFDAKDFRKNKVNRRYFSKFDLNLLREMSDNKFSENLIREFKKEGVKGFFVGLGQAFKKIGDGVFS